MATASRGPGRPRKEEGGHRYYETALHGVLVEKLPAQLIHYGRIDIGLLAEATGYGRATVGRRLHDNSTSFRMAKALVAIEGATLEITDLTPFIV